jgi:choline dehydrogenase-like flavoprotein
MASLGLPLLDDPNKGAGVGASFAPSSMHAQNQSRSDARTAYWDTIDRPNLHLATEQTVTRILLDRDNSIVAGPPFGYIRRAFGVEVS